MKKIVKYAVILVVIMSIVVASFPLSTVAAKALVETANEKISDKGFHLNWWWSYDTGFELLSDEFGGGWWTWTLNPKKCDIYNPEIDGRCGILSVVGTNQHVFPSVLVIYADSSLVKVDFGISHCDQWAKDHYYDYAVAKPAPEGGKNWYYGQTNTDYYGEGIQVNVQGYIADVNSSYNYVNVEDAFYYRAFIPKGGALVVYNVSQPMFTANPNAAVGYDLMKEYDYLSSPISMCVNY